MDFGEVKEGCMQPIGGRYIFVYFLSLLPFSSSERCHVVFQLSNVFDESSQSTNKCAIRVHRG